MYKFLVHNPFAQTNNDSLMVYHVESFIIRPTSEHKL